LWDIGLLQNNQWSPLPINFLARIILPSTAKGEMDNGFSILGSGRDSSLCLRAQDDSTEHLAYYVAGTADSSNSD
jgi:hypothetical protein